MYTGVKKKCEGPKAHVIVILMYAYIRQYIVFAWKSYGNNNTLKDGWNLHAWLIMESASFNDTCNLANSYMQRQVTKGEAICTRAKYALKSEVSSNIFLQISGFPADEVLRKAAGD